MSDTLDADAVAQGNQQVRDLLKAELKSVEGRRSIIIYEATRILDIAEALPMHCKICPAHHVELYALAGRLAVLAEHGDNGRCINL